MLADEEEQPEQRTSCPVCSALLSPVHWLSGLPLKVFSSPVFLAEDKHLHGQLLHSVSVQQQLQLILSGILTSGKLMQVSV